MTPTQNKVVPFRQRLTVRLTGGVILVLLVIGVPFLFAFHAVLRNEQQRSMAGATAHLSRVLLDGLRSSMLSGEPHLLDDAVRNLALQEEVEQVALLDHRGAVRVSSDRELEGDSLDRKASCDFCHAGGRAEPATRTSVLLDGERRIFRTLTTIPNDGECHTCHDPSKPSNGILLLDLQLASSDRRFLASFGGMLGLGTLMAILTIVVLVLLLRRLVHRPLNSVMDVSRRIVEGDLDARASVDAPGEFELLASRVNQMTDHLARTLETVESNRRELRSILDSVDDEIVVLDRERRVVVANMAFEKHSSTETGHLTGSNCLDVSSHTWACDTQNPDGCPVRRVFQTGESQIGIISRTGPDGEERALEIHASPVRGPDGTVLQVVEVRRDISGRRQMEASINNSERLASLGLLASGLSHEINNPLGAIATSVAGLRRRLKEGPGMPGADAGSLDSILERIAAEVERGKTITHRLLRIARPAGATRALIDVNRVVEDVVAIQSSEIKNRGLKVEKELAADLPALVGDESPITQVVMNLTLNAIQSMNDGSGTLRLGTVRKNGGIQVSVEDTGSGIPPEAMGKIYEPFFTTKPVGKGTGLGLFITHRIITDMGGTITVKSRPGEGSRISVFLPASGEGRRA